MKRDKVKILEYRSEYQPYFEKFNRAWIEKYFHLEEIDRYVLEQPEEAILANGGAILFLTCNDLIAGTVALKKVDHSTFEFTKMAIDEPFRGKGLGEALGRAAIEKAIKMGASKLILYSNRSLVPALKLYRKMGFKEIPLEQGGYERCDIKMGMRLDDISITRANNSHAMTIAAIGKRSFYEAFKPFFNKQQDLLEYLDFTYESEKIAASIEKPNNVFFIALSNGRVIGFAKVKKQSINKKISTRRQMELQKIYVLKEYHGKGVAAALMQHVLELAESIHTDLIWLDVLQGNERAIRFYEKNGFTKFGLHYFTIGSQVFSYDIMTRAASLPESSSHTIPEIMSYGNH